MNREELIYAAAEAWTADKARFSDLIFDKTQTLLLKFCEKGRNRVFPDDKGDEPTDFDLGYATACEDIMELIKRQQRKEEHNG